MHTSNKLAVTLLFPLSFAFATTPEVAVMDLQNIHCIACLKTVEKALQKVPGVEDTKLDLDSRTATVKYDPAKTNTDALAKATAAAGFPSTARK